MEAGSLLQEALSSQAEQQDIFHSEQQVLHLDVYRLSLNNDYDNSNHDHDNDFMQTQLLQLTQLAHKLNQCFSMDKKYDWHVGGDGPIFGIHATNHIPHLRALCRYGVNVADEWTAIDCILNVTKQFPDVVVECWDVQDGQILFIESANVLPVWVDLIGPEACRHRCWIRQGMIQFIAPNTTMIQNGMEDQNLSLQNALRILERGQEEENCDNLVETPTVVQQVIQDCIDRFLHKQQQSKDNSPTTSQSSSQHHHHHHKAALTVPRSVAHMIQQRPDLVNAAIVAFAQHALHTTTHQSKKKNNNNSNKNNPDSGIQYEDWVWTTHSFSRTNYAMLRTIVSPSWRTESYIPPEFQSAELRRVQRQAAVDATPHLRHAVQVGVRLVVGFNLLLSQQQYANTSLSVSLQQRRILSYWPRLLEQELNYPTEWLLDAWKAGPNYAPFPLEYILQCPVVLEEIELEPNNITLWSYPDVSLASQIRQQLKKSEISNHQFLVPRQDEVDTNENWMMLSPDTVDEQMETMTGKTKRQKVTTFKKQKNQSPTNEQTQAAQLDSMLNGFETFMVDKSGVEGVSHNNIEDPSAEITVAGEGNRNTAANSCPMKSQARVSVNPRVFLHLLKTTLDPSTPPDAINFSVNNSKNDDGFFSKDDYELMLPMGEDDNDDEDDDEDKLPMDTDVLELMSAMDSELQGTSAFSGTDGDQTHILTNLLQSLDAGAGGTGPVQNMMKAMGAVPPLVSPCFEDDEE